MSDHYEELGVEPTAGKDEIRDAHRARLAELEAARARKGVTEAQLQASREEAARVRGAWNVLSDPMQRQRYDQQLMDERAGTGDDDGLRRRAGRRRLARRACPHRVAQAARPAAGQGHAARRVPRARPAPPGVSRRRRRAPIARRPASTFRPGSSWPPTKARGMALAFDLAICIVLAFICFNFVPNLIQSDYTDIVDQVAKVTDVHDAQRA